MARANLYQPSGSTGEISPRLHARTDFAKYGAAWALCENMIPLAEGAMTRRPGTRYVHALNDQTKRGRLVRFEFSNTQAYPLVFEEEAIYFNRNQGRILVADTDAAISNGTFDTDLTDWDDQSTGSASIAHAAGTTVQISRTLGTAIGNMTALGGLAAAFDGVTTQAQADSASTTGGPATGFIGKNWGAGNKKTITGFTAYGSNNEGFFATANPDIEIKLQGSSDNFSADINDLATLTFTDTADESAGRSVLSGVDTSMAYQYHRLAIRQTTGGAGNKNCAECVFFQADLFPESRMSLVGNGSDIAWGEQDVTTAATGTEHILAFRVIGTPGDTVQISIGTTSTGGELVNDAEYGIGWNVVAFTPNISPFYVQFKNPNDYTVAVDDVSLLDDQHLVLTTPYAEADLQDIYPVQSADVMYLFHQDYPTYKLLRFGHTSWSLQRVAWEDGPWLAQNKTATTATPSATSGRDITITFSSIIGINGGVGFTDADINRLIRIDNASSGADWGWGIITAVDTSKVIRAAVVDSERPFSTTNASPKWRLGSWSDETGWPRCGVFFEQRLFAGGDTGRPQNFVASQTSDFENMSPDSEGTSTWDGTVEDDDSFDYTLSSNQVDVIVSMAASADDMFILTSGGAWRPTSSGASMTPTDISVRRQISSGAAFVFPLVIDNVILFVQRGLRKIRELAFNFEVDGYRALDMTRLAQHMTRGKIREIAFQEEPESQVYALLENGKLPAMTFRREEDVVGWARHILGGAFSSGDAVVESVATIPGNNAVGQFFDSTERDEVWLIVKRTIDGATKRYVEFMERMHDSGTHDAEDAFFVDSGLTYDGSATDTITGLDHLEGQTVKVWADGDLHDDRTVSGGSITLDAEASVVQVGLAYKHKLRNLKSEGGAEAGTAVTKRKRIVKMGFVLLDARKFSYGPTSSDLTMVDLSSEGDFADGLFTGEIKRDWPDGWKDDPRVYIEGDAPAPFTLLALSPETDTKDFV